MASEFGVPVQAFPALSPPNAATVDTSQLSNSYVRQNVVIADPSSATGVAPVDPTLGLSVNVTQIPAVTGTVAATQSGSPWQVSVLGAVPIQPINGLTISSMPSVTVIQGTSPWVTSGGSSGGTTPVIAATSNGLTVNGTITVTQGTSPWVTSSSGGASGNTPVYAATSNGLTINGTVTSNQGTPLSATAANAWPVNVVSSTPNLTLTSLPTLTINTPTVNQGTPTSFANAWPVTNLNGNTISSLQSGTWTVQPGNTPNTSPWLVTTVNGSTITVVQPTAANLNATVTGTISANQSGAWTVTSNQGTAASATVSNAWPVNVVSSTPNLTLTSLPTVTVTGTVNAAQSGTWTVQPGNTPNTVPWLVSNLVGNTITVVQSTAANLQATVNQGTPLAATVANSWPVNVLASVPNMTLTSLPTITINTPTVNQGTPTSFANVWPVTNLNGNTITVLPGGTAGTPNANVMTVQGTTNMVAVSVAQSGVTTQATPWTTKQIGSGFSTAQVSVTSAITLIAATNTNRMRLTITNAGSTDIFLGSGNSLTVANGQLLLGVKGYPYLVRSTAPVYGVGYSGSNTVSYMEETI